MPYVTKETLLDTLTRFRERGDERWASKDDTPTKDEVSEMISDSYLTDEDVQDVLDQA